jgi:hypothetical protein
MESINLLFEPAFITKEEINAFHFVHQDVLSHEDERRLRFQELQKAMRLGNNEKSKAKITFATDDGIKRVETTVWAADAHGVMLKSGVYIPVHSICEVQLV